MRILDFFRRKKQPKMVDNQVKSINPNHYYMVNNKTWVVEESVNFKTQSMSDDVHTYGWTLEVRWADGLGGWCGWSPYWNNKIYYSAQQATEAALKCYLSKSIHEWRVRPLYVMDEMEYRNFKLDKLLNTDTESKKHEIKGWKVKVDIEVEDDNGHVSTYKRGTLFIQLENGNIFKVTGPSEKNKYGDQYKLKNYLIPNGHVVEVEIKDEKWAHPHLIKELKTKFKLK